MITMAEIRNLTRNGETFFPLTCTDALMDRDGNPVEIINDIFDVSEYNASGTPPVLAKYASLSAALAEVPASKQKGGMTIRYVQTSDNIYVQYRCIADAFTTDTTQWTTTAKHEAKSITYAQLKALRDSEKLVPGQFYRITDYVTTTTNIYSNSYHSAGHAFDVIVRADSTSVLNEDAYAALHEGDTYFANSKLEAWQLKYTIDNDTSRFAWADATDGKGVIYRMVDEYHNECPYDFKNILFARYKFLGFPTDSEYIVNDYTWLINTYCGMILNGVRTVPIGAKLDRVAKYLYTFGVLIDEDAKDLTVYQEGIGKYCFENKIDTLIDVSLKLQELNDIVMVSDTAAGIVEYYRNIFEKGCRNMSFVGSSRNTHIVNNTFGVSGNNNIVQGAHDNTFGPGCYENIILGCSYNTAGSNFSYNFLSEGASYNRFGKKCSNNYLRTSSGRNTFGDFCSDNNINSIHNIIGSFCSNNILGGSQNILGACCSYNEILGMSNILGDFCERNRIGYPSTRNVLGNNCCDNRIENYCEYNVLGDNCYFQRLLDNTERQTIDYSSLISLNTDEIYQVKDKRFYPLAHPDPSTQPSILPQRFGNLPIKEVLIASGREDEIPKDAIVIEAWSFNNTQCTPALVECKATSATSAWIKIKNEDMTANIYLPRPVVKNDVINIISEITEPELTFEKLEVKFSDTPLIRAVEFHGHWIIPGSEEGSAYAELSLEQISTGYVITMRFVADWMKLEDIYYDGKSLTTKKEWFITNSNNVTPDFTLIKYVGEEENDYGYGHSK